MTALDSMVRVHRWVLDEKQRKLADLRTLLEKLKLDLESLDAELEAEREASGSSDEAGAAFPAYAASVTSSRSASVSCSRFAMVSQSLRRRSRAAAA